MGNITSTTELKNAIRLLETERAADLEFLKLQFQYTCESLKPANLLSSALKKTASSSLLIDTILNAALVLTTGYLSKKTGKGSSGIFRKLLGTLLKSGLISFLIQHPDAIKSFGKFLMQHIHRKKTNPE